MSIEPPKTQYAKSGDVHIAYQVFGAGPMDLVVIPGFISHLEIGAELPHTQRIGMRLASFARVMMFDKRGTGLSDPVMNVPTLEERMDDIRAVMDAAGSERAAVLAFSEGGPLAILFAATYPERTSALVLYGSMARTTWAPDYPFGQHIEGLMESQQEFIAPNWGTGMMAEVFAPSVADDPLVRDWGARLERFGASPAMLRQLTAMFYDTDVRAVLPSVSAPTLVIHRKGDRVVNYHAGRYLAEQIPGARYVELPGIDHALWAGDADAVLDEVQEFLTGVRTPADSDRVLATVMFTDIVGSTEHAGRLGDRRWRELLDAHHATIRRELSRFRGNEVKTVGDGFLATFDGPARAIRCGQSIIGALEAIGIKVRIGLHTGECEIMGDDVGGIAVHIASRVNSLAGAGEVLVSSTVKDLVAGSGIQFSDRGTHALKGIEDEWRLFTVAA